MSSYADTCDRFPLSSLTFFHVKGSDQDVKYMLACVGGFFYDEDALR